ncbi:MAG: GxxExxY protein [Spirochaetales bacterium]|nr:GxxExxY protein [Spirochaetales bacterium]
MSKLIYQELSNKILKCAFKVHREMGAGLLESVHEAQLLNYLKLTRLPVGYLFNFNGIHLAWKRFVNTKGYP